MKPTLKIETVPVSSLVFDPSNARKHPEKNLAAIKGSLAKFGQRKPIVVRNGVVIAGNGTLQAAKELGWDKIDVVRADDMSATEATAFAIADNRTSEIAEWDAGVLGDTLKGLMEDDFDLSQIGFDAGDLESILPKVEPEFLADEDEIPEKVETICKPGDLWKLGNHRLLCGDSTDVLQVERLMGAEKADMVFTDPPYGVEIAKRQNGRFKELGYSQIIGDDTNKTSRSVYSICQTLGISNVILWGANYFADSLPPSPCWLVWDKQNGKTVDFADCELAWVNSKSPSRIFKHVWDGFRRDSERGDKRVHPTQKPVALAEWCFENYGKPKCVLDLFLGSGSTLIACEKTGRRLFGMEIDPHYCDIIINRWQNLTGKKAELIPHE